MPTLEGQWVTSFSGWMLFDPTIEPKDVETYDDFIARTDELPPLFAGYRVIPQFWDGLLAIGVFLNGVLKLFKQDPFNPPRSTRFGWRFNDKFEQREGYFAIAVLICLNFDGKKGLTGMQLFNRGGVGKAISPSVFEEPVRNDLTGSYSASINNLGVSEGTFTTVFKNTGSEIITNNHTFIVRSDDELEWMWTTSKNDKHPELVSSYRPLVTRGTLRRVTSTITS